MTVKNLRLNITGLILLALLVLSACASPAQNQSESLVTEEPKSANDQALTGVQQTLPTVETAELVLATPISEAPAAGICAESEEAAIRIVIQPDMPSPRCVKVFPAQHLIVLNETEMSYTMSLGSLEAEVGPGEEYTFDVEFGKFLLPGVHRLELSDPPGGAEIWLLEGTGSNE